MKKRNRANFNDLTNYHEKSAFSHQIVCECGNPVSPYDEGCGKCGRKFSWKDMIQALATQTKLRADERNKRNRKYIPPEIHIHGEYSEEGA